MMTTTLTTKIFFFVLPSCSSCFRGVSSVLACLLWLSSNAFAATTAIRAGKVIAPDGKAIASPRSALRRRRLAPR